uniref:Uncharacterized protein n=1 Tax=Strongyloides stercoralis TaxID=6248 RepID=A0AAF5I442_STRER
MNTYYFKLFVLIVCVIKWIYPYSNKLMYDAVCISRKYNSDAITAKEIKIQSLFIYNEQIDLDYRVIKRWKDNLLSLGCFKGQPKSEILNDNSRTSIRRLSKLTGVSKSTIQRLLHKNNYKTYKPIHTNKQYPNDMLKRKQFCTWLQEQKSNNFHRSIYYSDEAVFHINGCVNKHNNFIWATENPNVIEEKSNNPKRLIVWVLIGYEGIVKYKIFESTVTTEVYKDIVENNVTPFFTKRRNTELIFQQDGAPAHFASKIKDVLNNDLKNRWIGRGSNLIEGQPRSPDLTLCDYFLWGYLKDKVYSHNIANLENLKNAITEELTNIPLQMIKKAVDNIVKRCKKCIEYNGDHFEMFLDKECN